MKTIHLIILIVIILIAAISTGCISSTSNKEPPNTVPPVPYTQANTHYAKGQIAAATVKVTMVPDFTYFTGLNGIKIVVSPDGERIAAITANDFDHGQIYYFNRSGTLLWNATGTTMEDIAISSENYFVAVINYFGSVE